MACNMLWRHWGKIRVQLYPYSNPRASIRWMINVIPRPFYPQERGWVGQPGRTAKWENSLAPVLDSSSRPSSPYPSHYTDCAIPASSSIMLNLPSIRASCPAQTNHLHIPFRDKDNFVQFPPVHIRTLPIFMNQPKQVKIDFNDQLQRIADFPSMWSTPVCLPVCLWTRDCVFATGYLLSLHSSSVTASELQDRSWSWTTGLSSSIIDCPRLQDIEHQNSTETLTNVRTIHTINSPTS